MRRNGNWTGLILLKPKIKTFLPQLELPSFRKRHRPSAHVIEVQYTSKNWKQGASLDLNDQEHHVKWMDDLR